MGGGGEERGGKDGPERKEKKVSVRSHLCGLLLLVFSLVFINLFVHTYLSLFTLSLPFYLLPPSSLSLLSRAFPVILP